MLNQGLFTPVFRSRTLSQVGLMALIVGAYAGLAVWKENSPFKELGDFPIEIHTSLSLVLGLLLVFRTNAAYNRWWEARTLWGSLVNASRNLTVKLHSLGRIPQNQVDQAGQVIVAFAYALRDHLREEQPKALPPEIQRELLDEDHVPGYLVNRLYASLGRWKAAGWLDGDELRVVDRELARFLDICGGCERILRTRIARSYRTFARQCVLLFLITYPWGIVNAFQWWAIPLTVIMAYFMLGLEVVAENVEEPFGYDEDDLDLDGLCKTIDRTVHQLLRQQVE